MPVPPPSQDIEAALIGLVAILERAVEQTYKVIDGVKAKHAPPADLLAESPDSIRRQDQSDDI